MQHSCDGRSSLPVPFEAFAPSWFSQNYCYQRSWQTPRDWTQFHFFTFPWTLTLQSYILYGWSPAKNVYTVFVLIHFTLAEELTECSRDGFWCMLASVHQPFCGRWQPVPRKRKHSGVPAIISPWAPHASKDGTQLTRPLWTIRLHYTYTYVVLPTSKK